MVPVSSIFTRRFSFSTTHQRFQRPTLGTPTPALRVTTKTSKQVTCSTKPHIKETRLLPSFIFGFDPNSILAYEPGSSCIILDHLL